MTSACFKHLGARSRTESRSDTLSNSHHFQPLMFHHCYEAVQLTAPVLWSHASGISHTASDEYASRRPAMSVGFNMLALQMCYCLTRLPAALLESIRLSKSMDKNLPLNHKLCDSINATLVFYIAIKKYFALINHHDIITLLHTTLIYLTWTPVFCHFK